MAGDVAQIIAASGAALAAILAAIVRVEVRRVHVLVNNRSEQQDKKIEKQGKRIDQLVEALERSNVAVPARPAPVASEVP